MTFPHTWVLLGSGTVGKAMGRPLYVQTRGQLFPTCVSYAGYAHQREESSASALPYCFSVFCFLGTAFSSVYHRPILEEGRCEKMEFPDVSSFPCPSPYRGCGKRQFGNQIHHLMRSFQSSTINIVWGSFFRPLAWKNFENLFQCSSVLP